MTLIREIWHVKTFLGHLNFLKNFWSNKGLYERAYILLNVSVGLSIKNLTNIGPHQMIQKLYYFMLCVIHKAQAKYDIEWQIL